MARYDIGTGNPFSEAVALEVVGKLGLEMKRPRPSIWSPTPQLSVRVTTEVGRVL